MAQYGSPEYVRFSHTAVVGIARCTPSPHFASSLSSRPQWEGRYAKDAEPFDWYQRCAFRGRCAVAVPAPRSTHFSAPATHPQRARVRPDSNPIFRGIITTHVPKESAILVPGCGSSTLSEDLLDDGFTGGIASFDISRTVVDDLANRLKDRKGLSFQIMNCTALNFPDACFGAVIDKGALDCLLCGENSTANTGRYTHEVARVLKPGGVFIIVSYAAPELRLSCACAHANHVRKTASAGERRSSFRPLSSPTATRNPLLCSPQ